MQDGRRVRHRTWPRLECSLVDRVVRFVCRQSTKQFEFGMELRKSRLKLKTRRPTLISCRPSLISCRPTLISSPHLRPSRHSPIPSPHRRSSRHLVSAPHPPNPVHHFIPNRQLPRRCANTSQPSLQPSLPPRRHHAAIPDRSFAEPAAPARALANLRASEAAWGETGSARPRPGRPARPPRASPAGPGSADARAAPASGAACLGSAPAVWSARWRNGGPMRPGAPLRQKPPKKRGGQSAGAHAAPGVRAGTGRDPPASHPRPRAAPNRLLS